MKTLQAFRYLFLLFAVVFCIPAHAQTIMTIAGNGISGYSGDGGPATTGHIAAYYVDIDTNNNIYTGFPNSIRKIDAAGILSTIAGDSAIYAYGGDNGPATAAHLSFITHLMPDKKGNLYIADDGSDRVRKIGANGIISTIAGIGRITFPNGSVSGDGGPATAAEFMSPSSAVSDSKGNVYIGDANSNHVRKVDTMGIINTIAMMQTEDMAIDDSDNLYVINASGGIGYSGYLISKISPSGTITTIAGNDTSGFSGDGGPATAARINYPTGIAVDKMRNVYIADEINNRIRKIDTAGIITTIAGNGVNGYSGDGGPATAAELTRPIDVCVDKEGNVYIADQSNRIRKICPGNPFVAPITGLVNICMGTVTALTDTTINGKWTSSDTAVARVDNSGNMTAIAVGTTTISYTAFNNCGTAVATKQITVNPLPTAGSITGSIPICLANSHHLTDATSGGVWSSNNASIATIGSTGTVYGVAGGMDTISYSVTNSCGTAVATTLVTVNPLVSAGAITGTLSLCPGTTTALTATGAGGVWASSNMGIATVDGSGVVTGVSAGVAHITYLVSGVCNAPYTTAAVSVNALPVAGSITGVDSFCALSVTAFVDGAAGGVWSSSNTGVAVVNSFGFATGIAAGLDTLAYNVTNTCGSATAYKAVRVVPLAVAGIITGADSVCPAATIALSDAVTGGTWSSSFASIATIGSTGIATGVAPGVDTLFYTTQNYCSAARAEKVVTVNPLPVAGSISGAGSLCEGATTLFTDAISGGTWSSSNTGVATMGSAGAAHGVAAGGSTITYTVTNSCGAAAAVYPITINPLPVAGTITGAATVCLDAHTTLSDVATGGVWSSSVTGIATVDGTGVITGVATGAATISYVITNGCGAATATIPVTVNPLPFAGAISGADAVCVGDSIFLADGVSGGVWASGAAAIATVSGNGEVLGLSAGTTLVSYSVTNSCGTAVAAKAIMVNPLPDAGSIAGAAVLCVDSSIALSDAVSGGVWTSEGPDIAAVNAAGGVTGIGAGTAVIFYTISNNCGTANATVTVTVAPCSLGVTTMSSTNEQLNIYPNPATQQLTISAAYNITTITISNPAGQKIFSAVADSKEVEIDIATLPAGMYFIQVNGGVVRKFVKE